MPGFFSLFFWRLYKWLLRFLTRKCELLRICEGTMDLTSRTIAVANSLKSSRHKELRGIVAVTPPDEDVIDPDDALSVILKTKKISTEKYPNFVPCLKPCLLPIIALSALKGDVEKMRREAYSTDNDEHKQQLTKSLHTLIISDDNLGLFSREMSIASRVRHPNLVQFIGATKVGNPLILTELMSTSLHKELPQHLFTKQQILSIAQDVALGLNYLHLFKPQPIIHRDVSSPNVLLDPSASEAGYKAAWWL